jgi:integrase
LRNPNGFGSVYKLSGKRRKPFIVRKTTGWDDNGKQLYQTIGYYASRAEAITVLAQFNANPYDIDAAKVTFAEVFQKWSERKFDKISKSNINGYNAAFKLSEKLHEMKFVDIKTDHLQDIIDDCELGHGTLRKIKVLFNQLYKYAMEYDIVNKDYARYIDIGEDESESSREPFTHEEIQKLWDNVHRMDFIDTILIMTYTGLRPGELLLIKSADIDIENRTMRGGIKTKAGKNRLIPINNKILPLIQERLSLENEFFVINHEGEQMRYWNYYEEKWKKIMEQLEMEHKPHDCRHTFATLMDNAGANKVAIKRIMGHASQDITDKVYTHKDIDQLLAAIDLI